MVQSSLTTHTGTGRKVWSLLMCLLLPATFYGQAEILRQQFPYSLAERESILELDQDWQHDGLRFLDIPFELKGISSGRFSCSFDLKDSIPSDSVFLCMEGVAWEAEVELNGRFLGIQEIPMAKWVVGIHTDWLDTIDNQLILRLYTGNIQPLYPRPFLGIVGSVSLLTPQQRNKRRAWKMPAVGFADTVGIIAPYFRSSSFGFDAFEALRNLYPLKKQGIRHIFFPFPAGERFESLCAQLGFVRVDSLRPGTIVCPVNEYPYEVVGYPFSPRFWLDKEGYYTSYYGNMYSWDRSWMMPKNPGNHFLLVLLILFPLLATYLIKLLSPGFFCAPILFAFYPAEICGHPQ